MRHVESAELTEDPALPPLPPFPPLPHPTFIVDNESSDLSLHWRHKPEEIFSDDAIQRNMLSLFYCLK